MIFVRVSVRLFAMLRERAGRSQLELELPAGATVADVLAELQSVTEGSPVVLAVNRRYAHHDQVVEEGDELALVPPVSGGGKAEDVHVRIGDEPLDPGALSSSVVRDAAGAVVTFQGSTREVDRLDYEAYVEMARETIARLAHEARERHGVEAVAVEHRVGTVPRGEPSVVVAVSGAHRDESFACAREIIDRVKAEAPIWKREVSGQHAAWVPGMLPTGDR